MDWVSIVPASSNTLQHKVLVERHLNKPARLSEGNTMRIFSQWFTENFESFDWLAVDSADRSPERVVGPSQRPGSHTDSSKAGSEAWSE